MHPSTTAQQHAPIAAEEIAPSTLAMAQRIEKMITWIGSITSLVIHTIIFIAFFATAILHAVAWDLMLLVLTTVVSLEAIYLAIFIQMSVNRQTLSLKEVEEDVESIQEDVEELGENVEELGENVEELGENVEGLKEDVEDIQEDIGEISEDAEDEARDKRQAEMLETLTSDVKALLHQLETLKLR